MDFLTSLFVGQSFLGWPIGIWLGFVALVLVLLALDLGILQRKAGEISARKSLLLSAGYVSLGIAFSGVIYWLYYQGAPQDGIDTSLAGDDAAQRAGRAMQYYLTGFVVEKTLALDNVFVISLIFTFLSVPRHLQHRVLLWGILGVLVLRALMIGVGAVMVAKFSFVLYLFGAFLIWTGIAMLRRNHAPDLSQNKVIQFIKKRFRITETLHDNRFFVRLPSPGSGQEAVQGHDAKIWATPLFLALILVELADLVFAIDSVPAIFAITPDPFIVYTSNIFAVLGLRALYFALAAMVHRFEYLKYALSATLVFIGGKIFIGEFFPGGKFPAAWSLAITVGLISAGIVFSLWKTRAHAKTVDG